MLGRERDEEDEEERVSRESDRNASERASAATHLPAVMPSVGVSTRSRLILTVYAAVLGERPDREAEKREREREENVSHRARECACAG